MDFFFPEDSEFCRQPKVACREAVEGSLHGAGSGHHNNVPAGLEPFFVEAVNFPQASACPVSLHGVTQLFAGGNAHPILPRPIFAGVNGKVGIRSTGGMVQALENMIEL